MFDWQFAFLISPFCILLLYSLWWGSRSLHKLNLTVLLTSTKLSLIHRKKSLQNWAPGSAEIRPIKWSRDLNCLFGGNKQSYQRGMSLENICLSGIKTPLLTAQQWNEMSEVTFCKLSFIGNISLHSSLLLAWTLNIKHQGFQFREFYVIFYCPIGVSILITSSSSSRVALSRAPLSSSPRRATFFTTSSSIPSIVREDVLINRF